MSGVPDRRTTTFTHRLCGVARTFLDNEGDDAERLLAWLGRDLWLRVLLASLCLGPWNSNGYVGIVRSVVRYQELQIMKVTKKREAKKKAAQSTRCTTVARCAVMVECPSSGSLAVWDRLEVK